MFGVVAYFCPFVFTQKPPPPAAVIDFLCKARIQNFLINSISVRRAVERDCQTRACSNLTSFQKIHKGLTFQKFRRKLAFLRKLFEKLTSFEIRFWEAVLTFWILLSRTD